MNTDLLSYRKYRRVYDYVAANPGCTSCEIADAFKISAGKVASLLRILAGQNAVVCIGEKKVRYPTCSCDYRPMWAVV